MSKTVVVEVRMTVPSEYTAEDAKSAAGAALTSGVAEEVKLLRVKVYYAGHFKGPVAGEQS